MNRLLLLVVSTIAALFLSSIPAQAQLVLFDNVRIGNVISKHSTVGTTTALAIAAADVSPSLLAWKICNDAENTSTHLIVGEATDAATDGVVLGKGKCFECPNCNPGTLKLIKVKAQAASNGYSVVQYKQQ